ncbi:hypothetical protein [Microlunatus soli]|uniref:hypothetical protein n=1 Tax=Microlunatus soli TaxID=630515 RepID=UPI000B81A6B3|nr:hypothetical protein [Microlunatus soli]
MIGLVLAGLFGLLVGCSDLAGPPAQTSSRASTPTESAQLQDLVHRMTTAVDRRDRRGLLSLVSDRDRNFDATARMIMDNLLAIRPTAFTLHPTGHQRRLAQDRADLLGDQAYAAEIRVGWAVSGDRRASDQTVWITVVPAGDGSGLAWAGTSDGPDGDRPTPLWWLEPVHVDHDHRATVIGGDSVDTAAWLSRADDAVQDVARRLSGRFDGWNQRLVVIIPSTEGLLEQMLGVGSGAESGLAAITWPDGSSTGTAPIRVMINPVNARDGLSADIVLTHETVHVATASPASAAPTWLIEGLADYVAYQTYPQAEDAAADKLLTQVAASGPPAELPDQQAFRASGADLERSYTEAWLACYQIAQRYGEDKLLAFYAAVDRSPTGAVAPAARATLGIDQDQLVADWRTFLQQAAARGSI